MWPGTTLATADLRLYQNGRFLVTDDDSDSLSDTSLDSSDLNTSIESRESPEVKPGHLKPRKRVTFRTDESLVEVFEIPARGDVIEEEDNIYDVVESIRPKEVTMLLPNPEPDLTISGHNTVLLSQPKPASEETVVCIEDRVKAKPEPARIYSRPERPDRPVLHRNNNSKTINNNSNVGRNTHGQINQIASGRTNNIANRLNHIAPDRTNGSSTQPNQNGSCKANNSANKVNNRSDGSEVWGTYTVTHATAPSATTPLRNSPNKVPKSVPASKTKAVISSRTSESASDPVNTPSSPQKPTAIARRPFRVKSASRPKKKVVKPTKDPKTTNTVKPLGSDLSDGDQKLISMFLEKNYNDNTAGVKENVPAKVSKPKAVRGKGYRRITNTAKNREKEMINREMKGEGQKRIYRTPYNNISSLHRTGARVMYKRPNTADSSDSKADSESSKGKVGNKHSLSIDPDRLNSGPKVKVQYGRIRHVNNSNGQKKTPKDNSSESEKLERNGSKDNVSNPSQDSEKNTSKTNGFIFPEENKFHFPLMSQPKETTSQLVRLDTNMLSLYKKKLYAWHMANGAEGRVETPCISPMYEALKPS